MRAGAIPAATRAAAIVVAVALVSACGGGSPASSQPPPPNAAVTVDIRNIAFNPNLVTVHSGQTVAWKFDDGPIAHNVTGDGWASPDRTSGYFTHLFMAPGTYAYRCTIHSDMAGQAVVTP